MIDSNALAGFHILMKTGDALHAVLAKLFHFERLPKFSTMRAKPECVNAPANPFLNLPRTTNLEMHDPKGKRIRLLPFTHATSILNNQLTGNILADLDRLTWE